MTDRVRQVLLISDAPEERLFIEGACARADFVVLCADTAEDGLVLARRARPAIVVMAVRGGSLNAWVAARRLKSDPLTARTPVVVIAAAEPERRALRESRVDATFQYPRCDGELEAFEATLIRSLSTLVSSRES